MVLMSRPNPKSAPLRVALVTNHVRLADVAAQVNVQAIVAKARVLAEGLRDLGIDSPRLAIAGLNPHAGEKGELGTEEIDVIEPAIATLKADGIQLRGPISADTVFVRAIAGEFDATLALYHDQGIIPVKVYGFGHGVNWTLGLPIVRTSPDHGTAYDIAGTGRADPRSMVEAILLAAQLASRKRSARRPGRTAESSAGGVVGFGPGTTLVLVSADASPGVGAGLPSEQALRTELSRRWESGWPHCRSGPSRDR
jgi:4-hydroxythreonine-4-phosphate dehydrogenase